MERLLQKLENTCSILGPMARSGVQPVQDAEHGELFGLPYEPQYVNSNDGLPDASTEAMLRFKDVRL